MKTITTIFLINTLRATLDHVEQTPDVDVDYLGLAEFKRALITQNHKLQTEDSGPSTTDGNA